MSVLILHNKYGRDPGGLTTWKVSSKIQFEVEVFVIGPRKSCSSWEVASEREEVGLKS